jgi:hypothetical protein
MAELDGLALTGSHVCSFEETIKMPKRYTYVVTCIKETPIEWGIELESLGEAVPPKIVRFPYLTQPLTRAPYFHSGYDPMAYFKQLVKGVPEMLRGYNKRILNRIQSRMNPLQVGGYCRVKISYIDHGEGISPYNYTLQLEEEGESNLQGLNISNVKGQVKQPFYGEVDPMALIAQLNGKIRKLQADVDVIKEWLVEVCQPSQKIQSPIDVAIEAILSQESTVAATQAVTDEGDQNISDPPVEDGNPRQDAE